MGNALKPKPNNLHKLILPFDYNIQHLNLLLQQNSADFGFVLKLNPCIQFSQATGILSIPKGLNINFKIKMSQKSIQSAYDTMKYFQKTRSSLRMTYNPNAHCGTSESQECCVCLDKTADMMLPCYHSLCSVCVSLYIIQKEQRKCPICRQQWNSLSQLQNNLVPIVGDQLDLLHDVRQILFQLIQEVDEGSICLIKDIIKNRRSLGVSRSKEISERSSK